MLKQLCKLSLVLVLFSNLSVAETHNSNNGDQSVSGRKKVYNSIVVDAPIDVVWNRIKDFHDFSWAPTLVKKTENVGTKNGVTVGARRLLNGQFLDTMIAYSPSDYRINYSIDSGPSPISNKEISNYVGDLHLIPITSEGKTFVEWSGSWVSDSSEAIPYMNSIYISLLKDLADQLKTK